MSRLSLKPKSTVLFLSLVSLLLSSCSNMPCRAVSSDVINQPKEALLSVPERRDTASADPKKAIQALSNSIFVFKYNGEKQCGLGEIVSLEKMERELRDIKVFSRSVKNDGLMRTAVCGANTGSANVYEIATSDLKKAEGFGFKPWTVK
jgi:hypothetical protein